MSVPNPAQPCIVCQNYTQGGTLVYSLTKLYIFGRPWASLGGKGRKYTQNQGQGQPGARLREPKNSGFFGIFAKMAVVKSLRPWAPLGGKGRKYTQNQCPGARGQARDGQGRPWASLGRKGRKYTQNQKMYSSAKLYTREVPCV